MSSYDYCTEGRPCANCMLIFNLCKHETTYLKGGRVNTCIFCNKTVTEKDQIFEKYKVCADEYDFELEEEILKEIEEEECN